ncbi:hypothetical protein [Burkholderia sp. LMG 13014]|uniref:hypothetical protein n=1 Tax=Burkholderia sp. LMG 13014 TaxID=2709306 RepID=UPI0019633180|nr:hypothetical protein [Burkholderia sp. LMG 13014]
MRLTNDYVQATEVDAGLFAVMLSDGGWSVADGPGTTLSPADEMELAGWHVPVRFTDKEGASAAILSGPSAMFDISRDSVWTLHCVASGGVLSEEYARRDGASG